LKNSKFLFSTIFVRTYIVYAFGQIAFSLTNFASIELFLGSVGLFPLSIVGENDFPWCENSFPPFPHQWQPTNLVSTPIYFVSERDDDKHNLSHLASQDKHREKSI